MLDLHLCCLKGKLMNVVPAVNYLLHMLYRMNCFLCINANKIVRFEGVMAYFHFNTFEIEKPHEVLKSVLIPSAYNIFLVGTTSLQIVREIISG